MTTVISTYATHFEYLAVPLPRYAQIVGVPECAFFGVYNPDPAINADCPNIWSQEQRNEIEQALWTAQRMMENELTYPLYPQFITEETHKVKSRCFVLKKRYMIQAGIKAVENYGDKGIAYVAETGQMNLIFAAGALDGVSEDEIRVYHPGTDVLINPEAIGITLGGINDFLNITIPQCRCVKWSQRYNPISGLDISDLANFETELTVKREYVDTSQQVSFRKPNCASNDCAETLSAGCVRIKDNLISNIEVRMTNSNCTIGDYADFNYYAGLDEMPHNLAEAQVRLAHSLMVATPCPCEGVRSLWIRDRDIPDGAEVDRVNSRFGLSNGAWFAWQIVQDEKIVGGSNI